MTKLSHDCLYVVLDKRGYRGKYFSTKMYILGTHLKCLSEVLFTSTQNIRVCFQEEIIKIINSFCSKEKVPYLERSTEVKSEKLNPMVHW